MPILKMSATGRSLVAQAVAHLRTPLYRNAYAWMVSTGATAVLGILYWILAAKFYSEEAVGWNAAAISALMLLSGVSQLNLMSALVRFIPGAGRSTGRLVGYSYLISLLAALLLASALLWGFGARLASLNIPGADLKFGLWFILGVMSWSIFSLQDSVLTGLREAIWIPIENIAYAVVKIGLLVLLARPLPQSGIFLSWVVPVMLTLLPVNYLIHRRLIPRHVQASGPQSKPLQPGQIARFVAGNYAGSLFWLASMQVLPILVTIQGGAAAGAYFYLPWTVASALRLVVMQMTASLTVEGARDELQLSRYSYRFLKTLALLLVPAVIVVLLAAPFILQLTGSNYAAEGLTLLRLLVISVLPSAVILVYLSIARVQQKAAEIALVQGASFVLLVSLSYIFLPVHGIKGVGFAFLISETIFAIVLAITQLRPLLLPLVGQRPDWPLAAPKIGEED